MSSAGSFAYGVDYNDDLQKVEPDYYYYEGFEKFTFVYEKTGDKWVFTEFPAW